MPNRPSPCVSLEPDSNRHGHPQVQVPAGVDSPTSLYFKRACAYSRHPFRRASSGVA